MTKEQREILKGYLDNESSFPILTIEYPSAFTGFGNDNLKIVSKVKGLFPDEEWTTYVDVFGPGGRTIDTRRMAS